MPETLKLDLEFTGRYNEPNLKLVHEDGLYILEYNPHNGAWVITRQESLADVTDITVADVALQPDSVPEALSSQVGQYQLIS
ncbi:NAD-dependent deacetylase sirtuin-7 [Penicillium robsamsonii]|uniref:NAD-dependent deacetylase sirtuin-7 n=1 Tax=Penicillium robsamsonii TaxID=1792511 RepID=UPI0025467603|nr:NAD-dependent deacetylase sirtuin-7 [Penicillium robsamsonii]KAJ5813101.1 NAD-dependent deacetylase sirtuin-7 [Penicillium robsamsonii]